jgi:hypothetical protein
MFPDPKPRSQKEQFWLNLVYRLPVIRSAYFRLNRSWEATKLVQKISERLEGNGYNYEAAEVMACLRAGKLESEVMSLEETLSIVETMDEIRSQWIRK